MPPRMLTSSRKLSVYNSDTADHSRTFYMCAARSRRATALAESRSSFPLWKNSFHTAESRRKQSTRVGALQSVRCILQVAMIQTLAIVISRREPATVSRRLHFIAILFVSLVPLHGGRRKKNGERSIAQNTKS